jgi:hypothetical protein
VFFGVIIVVSGALSGVFLYSFKDLPVDISQIVTLTLRSLNEPFSVVIYLRDEN